jgi:hypothetical protein
MKRIVRYEPVIVAFVVAAAPLVGAFVVAVNKAVESGSNAATAIAILTGGTTLLGGLGAAWARANVSPVEAQEAARPADLP